ncbi:MAG: response regulator [Treponema sp.]|nr:response regulator [Treponema sp.]
MNKISKALQQAFILDAKKLVETISKAPKKCHKILNQLESVKNSAKLLGYDSVAKLCAALQGLYQVLADNAISFNQSIFILIKAVIVKITECCQQIIREGSDEADVRLYIRYCDKAAAGEIIDTDAFDKNKKKSNTNQNINRKIQDKIVEVHSKAISEVLNAQEEMIARSYKLNNQINQLKSLEDEPSPHKIETLRKQLSADFKILQTELESSHDEIFSFIKDDQYFAESHQEIQGFFVYANGVKYLISGEYLSDVTYESPLNYVTKQNQLCLERIENDKEVYIPVYFLSSLFPGRREANSNGLDTIFIAEYQGQRIGIIVDFMQTFISIVKKPLPNCFNNFPILKGLVFDEKFDMIPILYIPEILKRFRSLRGYDVKKFEVNSRPRNYRLLVVDDSETTREIEKLILSDFMVDLAVDGINGLEMARANQYDLILTDDAMPRMNGETFLDNLRLMENYSSVPVLAFAAQPLEKADAFINKAEFKRSELIHSVKELLND